jgi:endonuclease YncB( thermonuclease family)
LESAEHILPYLAPDAVVFIHDFVVRPHYHSVAQKHYKEIARVSDGQTLVVLKPSSPQGEIF